MTNRSSSNVAHGIYCNYLQCLSKKLTFFGPPQLKSLKYLAMCWQAIHISLRRNMIFVNFRMLLLCLLLLLHWPQYYPTQLRCKMVEFETLTQSQMVRHALSLHWTSLLSFEDPWSMEGLIGGDAYMWNWYGRNETVGYWKFAILGLFCGWVNLENFENLDLWVIDNMT